MFSEHVLLKVLDSAGCWAIFFYFIYVHYSIMRLLKNKRNGGGS